MWKKSWLRRKNSANYLEMHRALEIIAFSAAFFCHLMRNPGKIDNPLKVCAIRTPYIAP
tara:strand:+ start:112 stop:288 length:177 start_codon:yes stop_codon:yes gene_type:complete